MTDFDAIPLPPSPLGREAWEAGRALVLEHGLLPRHVMWDCDEVLWDWVMSARRVLVRSPIRLVRRDLSHREWFQAKPGVFELLWGMHHGAVELGDESPWIRLWTNGYHWRIWAIARQIPGFAALLGPPADLDEHHSFATHPRIFARSDFASATAVLMEPTERARWLEKFGEDALTVLEDQLANTPFDSHLKIPELAAIIGKTEFSDIWVLVDDLGANIKRFVLTGRSGVRVLSSPSRVARGRIPNMTWGDPWAAVERASCVLGPALAGKLLEVARSPRRTSPDVDGVRPVPGDYPRQRFEMTILDRFIREQWLAPVRELKDRFG